jgi:hypothetical protein
MKVKDLIAKLQKCDPEREVCISVIDDSQMSIIRMLSHVVTLPDADVREKLWLQDYAPSQSEVAL